MEFSLQDDEFGGDFPATNATRASGSKRSFNDLEDDEDRIQKGETEIVFPGVSLALLFFTVLRDKCHGWTSGYGRISSNAKPSLNAENWPLVIVVSVKF
ncbi:hypothetical protein Bca4012_011506 [Brassica carinata]